MNEFEESNKARIKEMTAAEKLQYFKDYYLLKVLGIGAALAIVVYGLYTYFRPQPVPVLRVAVFDNVADEEGLDALTEELRDLLDAHEPNDDVRFTVNFRSTDSNDLARLGVLSSAQEIDAVAAPKAVFEEFASYGYFAPLEEYFTADELTAFREAGLLTETAGLGEEEAASMADLSGLGEVLPYGISLKMSSAWQSAMLNPDEYVIGIAAGAVQPENAAALIRFLTETAS